jgi:hypothetical protein
MLPALISQTAVVRGMRWARPPNSFMSCVPDACCTEPAVRNNPPWKKPWFKQCRSPAVMRRLLVPKSGHEQDFACSVHRFPNIGATIPEEIAVSVVAELIADRRRCQAALPYLGCVDALVDEEATAQHSKK